MPPETATDEEPAGLVRRTADGAAVLIRGE
jgi:hypothetical protein